MCEGSLVIADVAKMESCTARTMQVDSPAHVENLAVHYVHDALRHCLIAANKYRSAPPNGSLQAADELLTQLTADCFGENGRNFVLLHLSPFQVDFDVSLTCAEYGKRIMTGLVDS